MMAPSHCKSCPPMEKRRIVIFPDRCREDTGKQISVSMFGSAPCILDTRHEFHSISVGRGLFIVGVARGVADLHAERSRRRSPMDEGQCERAGPVVSEGQEGGVDLHYNQSDPSEPIQVSAHQNQNLTQTQLDDGQRVGCDSIEQDSLNGNRDEEEEEDDDDVIVEEEKDSVTAPDTPMTDSSFSDTGSLVELHPSVSPETTCPISPVAGSPDEPSYSNPEGKTHTSTTEPTTSTTEPTTSTTEPTTSTTEPTTSITEPTGPTSTTEPTTSITEPTGPTSTTEPTGPTSTTEPTTSTTEPITTLLASLQELGERKDHSHLPQSLHQIAEAFVLQEDYERAVCCVQLERLYHQRRLHNLTTLQEQWERRCRSDGQGERNSNTNLAAQQLDRLAYICKTHQRPSPGTEKCEAVDSVSVRVEDKCPSRSSALDVAQNSRDSKRIEGFHRDRLIDSSLAKGEEREGRAEFTGAQSEGTGQQTEREMEHTTQEGYAGPDPPTDGEISRSKPEERLGGEEEQEEVEEAEEEKDSDVCFKALEEISVLAVKEQLTLEEVQQEENQIEELCEEYVQEEDVFVVEIIRDGAAALDGLAKLITVEMTPAPSLVSILKKRRRSVCVENVCVAPSSAPHKHPAKRRVRFKVPDDGFDQDQVGGDSCLLLFLLCLVTVVISLGGTAVYCALGNAHSTVCTDFSRNADFYLAQLHRGMNQLRHWLTPGF
ncbi:consortin-like isoform X2 [Salvelinus fontinalis]|uniref:consortin-like isoform X2 n=1 Tax=Salvelinus fontinalis TaxID=8038 RepID=UPI002486C64A|nr:consortin-like isoform X2 [Salvelinus fontinalis]